MYFFSEKDLENDSKYKCKLIGNVFSYFLQFLLLVLSFSILVYKRYIESPKRSWIIWIFDVSKQLIGAFCIHFLNILVSGYILNVSGSDECAWYFLNYFIDCTFGIVVVYFIHNNIQKHFNNKYGEDSSLYKIGYYNTPPDNKVWFKQFSLYVFSLFMNKIIITLILYATKNPMADLGNWLFNPLQSDPDTELLVVMILCPLILSSLQYWLFDNMLKKKIVIIDEKSNYSSFGHIENSDEEYESL
jgi:hypothetical protein